MSMMICRRKLGMGVLSGKACWLVLWWGGSISTCVCRCRQVWHVTEFSSCGVASWAIAQCTSRLKWMYWVWIYPSGILFPYLEKYLCECFDKRKEHCRKVCNGNCWVYGEVCAISQFYLWSHTVIWVVKLQMGDSLFRKWRQFHSGSVFSMLITWIQDLCTTFTTPAMPWVLEGLFTK